MLIHSEVIAEFGVPGRCFITVDLPIDGEQTAVKDGEYCDKDETQQLHTFIKIKRSRNDQAKYNFPSSVVDTDTDEFASFW